MVKRTTLTQAFANFGATPVNVQWACSAITEDGKSIVINCWNHRLKPQPNDRLTYEDSLSHWKNRRGANLLHTHLTKAKADNLPLRLILVTTADKDMVPVDARSADKTFANQYDLVGRLVSFNSDTGDYAIEFTRV